MSEAVKALVAEVVKGKGNGTVYVALDGEGNVGVWTDDYDLDYPRYASDLPATDKDAVAVALGEVAGFSVVTDEREWLEQLQEWYEMGGGTGLAWIDSEDDEEALDAAEKVAMILNLAYSVADELVKKVLDGTIPDEWDGHELRRWFAETSEELPGVMAASRAREYNRVRLVNNL